jgi:hypothetical protein
MPYLASFTGTKTTFFTIILDRKINLLKKEEGNLILKTAKICPKSL